MEDRFGVLEDMAAELKKEGYKVWRRREKSRGVTRGGKCEVEAVVSCRADNGGTVRENEGLW